MIVIEMRMTPHEWEKKNLTTLLAPKKDVMMFINAGIVAWKDGLTGSELWKSQNVMPNAFIPANASVWENPLK